MIDIKRRSEKVHMTDGADIRFRQNILGKKNYKINNFNITLRTTIQS